MTLLIKSDGASEPIRVEPGGVAAGLEEDTRYRIVCEGANTPALLIDEELLPAVEEAGERCWIWTPRFYAGQVSVELRETGAASPTCYRFDVSPRQDKLGQAEFAAMVQELSAFRKALLLGTEPARIVIGNDGEFVSLNLWYSRLRQYGDAFCRALRGVAERPIKTAVYTRTTVLAHRVKRADRQTALSCVRSPLAGQLKADSLESGVHQTPILDVPSFVETQDVPANRTLAYFLMAVLARARRVLQQLEQQSRNQDVDVARTELAVRWPERSRLLGRLERELRKLNRSPPFSTVSRREITTAGLNAISASPLYGRAHRLAWRILRAGIAGNEADELQWMSPSWEIYERWCFLQVVRVVARIYGVSEQEIDFHHSGEDSILAVVETGSEAYEIWLQDRFPAFSPNTTAGKYSISRQRHPDITIVRKTANGYSHQWLCLDAKYRVSRQGVLDAMASAHIYHDSLRFNGQPPAVSLLLTPAPVQADWLMDADFISQEKVGVVSTNDLQTLTTIIETLFSR